MGDTTKVINVNIAFLNLEATEALKTYATDKVKNCVQKFTQKDTDVHVVLKVERTRQIAEATLHATGADFAVKEESDDLYAS